MFSFGIFDSGGFDPNAGTFVMMAFILVGFVYLLVSGRLPGRNVSDEIAQLKARIAECEAIEHKLKLDNADLHNVMRVITSQNTELNERVKTLEEEIRRTTAERDKLRERNGHLEYLLDNLKTNASDSTAYGVNLRDALIKTFSLAELQALCADLGVDYEALDGDTKIAKTQAIVLYFQRRDELALLTAAIKQRRPNVRL